MNELKNYIYESVRSKILSWSGSTVEQIYVISFYISNVNDDPRKPMITLGYNTIKHFRSSVKDAGDMAEAKWNYAFWLQNEELIIGDNYGQNLEDGNRITKWLEENDLYYTDEEEKQDFNKTLELGEEITHEFVTLCVDVVKKLHYEGVVINKFGKTIPIIIHELEYYDEIAEQNEIANPPEAIEEFANWIEDMY